MSEEELTELITRIDIMTGKLQERAVETSLAIDAGIDYLAQRLVEETEQYLKDQE